MQGMRVDFITNTIVITKAFREEASNMDSEEYKALNRAIEENPRMKVVLKSRSAAHNKNEYKGLTYKFMRRFIKVIDKENLVTFEETIEYYEELYSESGKVYQCVRDWFIENYPNYKEMILDTAPQRIAA